MTHTPPTIVAHPLPTVVIHRTVYAWIDWDSTKTLSETTVVETFDPVHGPLAHGTPVAWAVATICRLAEEAEEFEPSVFPIPDALPAYEWLAGTRDLPHGFETMHVCVHGVTPRERADIFRLLARPTQRA